MIRRKQKLESNYCIYFLIDPRPGKLEIFYVGLSRRVENRFKSHLRKASDGTHSNEELGRRLRSILHAKALPACVIIYNGLTGPQAAQVEKELIYRFNHCKHDILNLTSGGELGGGSSETPKKKTKKRKKRRAKKFQRYLDLWGFTIKAWRFITT